MFNALFSKFKNRPLNEGEIKSNNMLLYGSIGLTSLGIIAIVFEIVTTPNSTNLQPETAPKMAASKLAAPPQQAVAPKPALAVLPASAVLPALATHPVSASNLPAYSAELFGTVDALSGSASVSDQSGKITPISAGLKIYAGHTINSGPDGEVHLITEDGGIIALRPDTVFRVDEYKAEGGSADKIYMSLLSGAARSITGWIGKHDTSAYRMNTPDITIGIRGTDHEVTVVDKGDDEPGTYDTVNEGSTVMKTPQGETEVSPGKFAFAPKGRAVAPFFLAQQPRFWARRRLKIEGRIQQRKEFLRGRFEQMREERINHLKPVVSKRRGEVRRQEHSSAIEKRNELRKNRQEKAKQSKQAYREQHSTIMRKGSDKKEGHIRHRNRE